LTYLRSQGPIQFFEQFDQIGAKDLMGPAQAAVLGKGGILEVLEVHGKAGGDIFANQVQPTREIRVKKTAFPSSPEASQGRQPFKT
jgi:hypothetical protein